MEQIEVNEPRESIYGDKLPELEEAMNYLVDVLKSFKKDIDIEHIVSRIKSEESMREKCRRRGLPETTDSALNQLYDAVGVRVVCAFVKDVYRVRSRIMKVKDIEVVSEKDYIRHAKPNGYRSLHMLIKVRGKVNAEIQLRTISMDTWAALEHHMKYKKNISDNVELITGELKRCADELASTDISMQTLKDMIYDDAGTDDAGPDSKSTENENKSADGVNESDSES